MNVQELVTNPKVGQTIAAATTTTGLGTILDWIPDDIGKLATLIGIVLSVVLIRLHWLGVKKQQLELDILKEKEAERLENARLRRAHGQPVRRGDDAIPLDES